MARKSEKAPSKKSAAKEEPKAQVVQPIAVVEPVGVAAPVKTDGLLKVNLSSALYDRLKSQAEEEGLSLEDYTRELLAESATLRAFEIVERRFQMRGGNSQAVNMNRNHQHPNQGGGNRPNHNNSNNNNNNHNNRRNDRNNSNNNRRMSHARYQNIMDDKATFLEYVRNQERQQR